MKPGPHEGATRGLATASVVGEHPAPFTSPGRDPLVTLSPAQQQVVAHRGADLQVIACAGSGKTESISRRVAALIEEGAEPGSIVAFTFTERAAAELKERIVQRVAEVKGAAFRDRLAPMFVGTIHAYCFRLLQDHVPRFGSYDILDENRHAGLLSREYRAMLIAALCLRGGASPLTSPRSVAHEQSPW